MSNDLDSVYAALDTYRRKIDKLGQLADKLLTDQMQDFADHLARRFPRRRIEITSGMGSTSIEITPKPVFGEYLRIHDSYTYSTNPVFQAIAAEWEAMCVEHSRQLEHPFVNFTYDVIAEGRNYRA